MLSQRSYRTSKKQVNNSEEELTLEQLLERDQDKLGEIARIKESNQVDPEQTLLAEFGLYYGFDAMLKALDNEITGKQMQDWVIAARKINARKRYNRVIDMFMAHMATKTKKPKTTIEKYLKEINKQWQ